MRFAYIFKKLGTYWRRNMYVFCRFQSSLHSRPSSFEVVKLCSSTSQPSMHQMPAEFGILHRFCATADPGSTVSVAISIPICIWCSNFPQFPRWELDLPERAGQELVSWLLGGFCSFGSLAWNENDGGRWVGIDNFFFKFTKMLDIEKLQILPWERCFKNFWAMRSVQIYRRRIEVVPSVVTLFFWLFKVLKYTLGL